jgi:DNA-binding IclR family transcriptional regulator
VVVLRGADAVFVDCIESMRPVRVGSRVGQSMPANCNSGGKALLARLSREELHRLFPTKKLPRLTPASITSRRALEAELERIRSTGVAVNAGESEPDVYAAAAALSRTAALSVSIPLARADERRREEIASALRSAQAGVLAD